MSCKCGHSVTIHDRNDRCYGKVGDSQCSCRGFRSTGRAKPSKTCTNFRRNGVTVVICGGNLDTEGKCSLAAGHV